MTTTVDSNATDSNILEAARALRMERRIDESYELIRRESLRRPQLKRLVHQHHPILWASITSKRCILARRSGDDEAFVRRLWEDEAFVRSFHRSALPLPGDRTELQHRLQAEFASLIGDHNSIHWSIKDSQGHPWGLLSLAGVSGLHKRAEVLIGVLPDAPPGLSVAAMLILFDFYFKVLKFNKLVSLHYPDNEHSRRTAMHLGFREEGRLRSHVFDERERTFVDLIQLGLLSDEAFSEPNLRLKRRLLAE